MLYYTEYNLKRDDGVICPLLSVIQDIMCVDGVTERHGMIGQGNGETAAMTLPPRAHGGLDRLAISASTLCLIHCLLLPVLIAFLPSIAAWADLGEGFHIVMLAIAVPLSTIALWRAWRRHGQVGPAIGGALGLSLLILGVVFEGGAAGTWLTVAGGMVLAVAHVLNLRADRLAALVAL